MRRTRAHSVRTHLIAYGVALAIPLLLLLGVVLGRSAVLERAQVEERLQQVAQYLADDIDREIDRRIAILQTLASSPVLASGDLLAFHAQASPARCNERQRRMHQSARSHPVNDRQPAEDAVRHIASAFNLAFVHALDALRSAPAPHRRRA